MTAMKQGATDEAVKALELGTELLEKDLPGKLALQRLQREAQQLVMPPEEEQPE